MEIRAMIFKQTKRENEFAIEGVHKFQLNVLRLETSVAHPNECVIVRVPLPIALNPFIIVFVIRKKQADKETKEWLAELASDIRGIIALYSLHTAYLPCPYLLLPSSALDFRWHGKSIYIWADDPTTNAQPQT